jgi:hypothetical protein
MSQLRSRSEGNQAGYIRTQWKNVVGAIEELQRLQGSPMGAAEFIIQAAQDARAGNLPDFQRALQERIDIVSSGNSLHGSVYRAVLTTVVNMRVLAQDCPVMDSILLQSICSERGMPVTCFMDGFFTELGQMGRVAQSVGARDPENHVFSVASAGRNRTRDC